MALQIRRGTEAERLTITPLAGEVVFTTDTKYLYVGDGITVGGVSVSEQSQDAIASLVSGSHTGIYFTYNDSTNQLTATVTGGVDSLNTLTDVSISGAVNDHLLKYAAGVGWINGSIGIDVLNDVNIVNPVAETVLKYDGAAWINGRISLDSLSDVTLSSGWTLNDILYFNGTTWTNGAIPLEALSNIVVSNPQVGHVIKWNGTNWINAADELGDLGSTLDSLSDVIVTDPLIGQTIKFDGYNWINSESDFTSLSDVNITGAVAGQTIMYTGFQWVNVDNTLEQLNDVLLTSGWTTNEVLLFDGSKWTNSKVPLSGVNGVYVSTPAIGQVLKYDGYNWVNSSHGLFDDANPTLSADLGLNNQDIIGIGNIDIVGTIKATTGLGGDLYLNTFDLLGTGDIAISGSIGNQAVSVTNGGLVTIPNRFITIGETTATTGSSFVFNQVDGASAILVKTVGNAAQSNTSKIKFEARGTSLVDASATRLLPGDFIGSVSFSCYEPTISNDLPSALIVAKTDPTGVVNATNANGKLEFMTAGGTSSFSVNYLTFDSKGQLAVNKQTAEATVDINGFMKLGILTAAPASPSAGMVAIADGTSWDPMVTGKQTMVVYLGTGWVQIAVAA